MINEFDRVKIKENGIIGEVVDIYINNAEKVFLRKLNYAYDFRNMNMESIKEILRHKLIASDNLDITW